MKKFLTTLIISISSLGFASSCLLKDDSTMLAEMNAGEFLLNASTDVFNPARDITAFSFRVADNVALSSDVTGSISGTSISLTVPYGTDVTALVPSITITGASVSPANGVARDFTSPVDYTVSAADGSSQVYTVTVTFAAASAKDITAFNFLAAGNAALSLDVTGSISGTSISLTVPFGTDLTALVPSITITGASVSPASGGAQDFTSPVDYTVTAADSTTQVYTITVTIAPNTAKDITAFNFLAAGNAALSSDVTGSISGTSISLTVPYGTDVTALVPSITITGASVSPANGVAQDFTSPVGYTVTAADSTTQVYTVTVTITAPSTTKDITAFNFLAAENAALSADVMGSISGTNISLAVPNGTDVTALVPSITITGASVSPASGVAQDFSTPIDYTVTAEDSSIQTYTVTILPCPTGYIPVPANAAMGVTADFCVAKYEMKNNVGAKSAAAGLPWVSIKRNDAIAACQALGAGYDMITNAEWQTIARNIENVASNWSGGAIGSGVLNRGHTDNNPSIICDASNEYVETDCSNTGNEPDFIEKRTNRLSNGEVIWDLGGNVREWVKDDNSVTWGTNMFMYLVTTDPAKTKFGPEGSYSCGVANYYCGLGYANLNYSTGAIFRGGSFSDGTVAGIFTVSLNVGLANLYPNLGFRCVRRP